MADDQPAPGQQATIAGKKGDWFNYDELVAQNGTVIGIGISTDGHVYFIKQDAQSTNWHDPVRLS